MTYLSEYYKKVEELIPELSPFISVRSIKRKLRIPSGDRSLTSFLYGILNKMEKEGKLERIGLSIPKVFKIKGKGE